MMKERKPEDKLIDEFYGESEGGEEVLKEYADISEKLHRASEKLDILNEDIFDIHIDTIGIIEAVEEIKGTRRARRELVLFVFSALAFLSLYALLGLTAGFRFIVISQLILITAMPWLIVPIAIKRRKGSEI